MRKERGFLRARLRVLRPRAQGWAERRCQVALEYAAVSRNKPKSPRSARAPALTHGAAREARAPGQLPRSTRLRRRPRSNRSGRIERRVKLRLTIHARPMARRTSFQSRCPGAELLG